MEPQLIEPPEQDLAEPPVDRRFLANLAAQTLQVVKLWLVEVV